MALEKIVLMPDNARSTAAPADEPALPTALDCLVLIGLSHGLQLSVDQLRRDNRLTSDTLTTNQLLGCARRAGFRCKTLLTTWPDLVRSERLLPAIVRFRDGSSMVLLGTRHEHGTSVAVLQDPNAAAGVPLLVDRIRFEAAWTGDLILFRLRRNPHAGADPFNWRSIVDLAGRERQLVRDLALSSLGLSLLALAPLLFVRLLVERVLPFQTSNTLVVLGLVMAALVVAETIFGAMRRFTLAHLAARVDAKLSTMMYDKVLALPMSFLERRPVGETASVMAQMQHVRLVLSGDLFGTLLDGGVLMFVLPVLLYLSPLLTLLVVVLCAIAIAALVTVLPRLVAATDGLREREDRRAAFLAESLAGIRTTKSLVLAEDRQGTWAELGREAAADRRDADRLSTRIGAVALAVERLLVAGTLAFGVLLSMTSAEPAQIGGLLAFYLLVQRMLAPLRQAAQLVGPFNQVRSGMAAVRRLMNHPAEQGYGTSGRTTPIQGAIQFDTVTFKYRADGLPALRAVSFEVPAGTLLGITGRNGSGKTTIARLLQRIYADHQGTIRLDGIDINAFDLAHLRRSVAVVGQDAVLLRGTIRETITAARPDATFEDMTAAARLAGADEFIDKLPRGYETLIQEGAPNLSAGQRQRLALARAVLTNPRILILDEATSALDDDIEALVAANLRLVARGWTVIVVTHNLARLTSADAILVMDGGAARDFGRHHELLERCDLYGALWQRQTAHPDGDAPADKLLALA